jgi:pimeloyl-ACP methyl ester carboxylesterase
MPRRASPALRWAMRNIGRALPGLAARTAQRIFFTPVHARPRSEEAALLRTAEKHQFVARHGRVAYWSWGTGPAVLLTHGWGGHAGHMTAFVAPLVAAGYRVIAVDQPAHGASAGKRSSLVHFAHTIEDLARAVGGFDAAVAHSMGTSAVTLALTRGLQLRRAVFIAATASFAGVWRRFREALEMPPAAWERMVANTTRWLGIGFGEIEPALLARTMTLPLLVIQDPGDRQTPLREGERLAAAWPGARLIAIPAGGHVRMLKNDKVIAAAVSFLQSSTAGAGAVSVSGRTHTSPSSTLTS